MVMREGGMAAIAEVGDGEAEDGAAEEAGRSSSAGDEEGAAKETEEGEEEYDVDAMSIEELRERLRSERETRQELERMYEQEHGYAQSIEAELEEERKGNDEILTKMEELEKTKEEEKTQIGLQTIELRRENDQLKLDLGKERDLRLAQMYKYENAQKDAEEQTKEANRMRHELSFWQTERAAYDNEKEAIGSALRASEDIRRRLEAHTANYEREIARLEQQVAELRSRVYASENASYLAQRELERTHQKHAKEVRAAGGGGRKRANQPGSAPGGAARGVGGGVKTLPALARSSSAKAKAGGGGGRKGKKRASSNNKKLLGNMPSTSTASVATDSTTHVPAASGFQSSMYSSASTDGVLEPSIYGEQATGGTPYLGATATSVQMSNRTENAARFAAAIFGSTPATGGAIPPGLQQAAQSSDGVSLVQPDTVTSSVAATATLMGPPSSFANASPVMMTGPPGSLRSSALPASLITDEPEPYFRIPGRNKAGGP